ncbi:MAG: tRNA uridine(34) 5-carboxymethylaminomethyl modification radical SAM/GNAT enzyme Elp3 [Myxococcales bacterium]|jgi:elongator complex protein 3
MADANVATGGRRRRPELDFDPEPHRESLLPILRELGELAAQAPDSRPFSQQQMHRVLRRHPRGGRGFHSRSELIAACRAFAGELGSGAQVDALVARLQLRPVRTQSGVTPVTVFTKPFPCPGECVFCPNDVRLPKSYLSREPGCQRAVENRFDPYLQTYNRLRAFAAIGHGLDKAELIILGGTFSHYPEAYQRWFVTRCLQALTDLGAGEDRREGAGAAAVDYSPLPGRIDGRDLRRGYNWQLTRFLRKHHDGALLAGAEQATWEQLERAQRDNETAGCRNVGLVVETRPDCVSEAEVHRLRRLGCTKVQIGLQSLSDEVLRLNKRGHDLADARRAMRLLREAGFKIHAHWMPNLLGSTPGLDLLDYRRLFDDADFRPDELKVYPCSLIESAELMAFHERGEYRPYDHAELLEVLVGVMRETPRYCRLSRVVRDISSADIVEGNRLSNFREIAERELSRRGRRGVDIRAREVKHAPLEAATLRLRVTRYDTAVGTETFLEMVDGSDRLAGFLRLSLPRRRAFLPEIAGSAVIRELHVYGAALGLGRREGARAQHRGLGRRLLEAAAGHAAAAGFSRIAVISAIGTREYYRRQGFQDGVLYQHMTLPRG